jgi:serine/threonine-protein kinase
MRILLAHYCCRQPDDAGSGPERLAFDGYRFEEDGCVGKGAYGAVFAVRDRSGQRRALKVFLHDAERDGPGVQSLVAEMTAGSRCESPFVARYDRLVICSGQLPPSERTAPRILCYVLREFVEGECPTVQNLQTANRLSVFRCLAHGLRDIHEAGLVHCDIKPQNAVFQGAQAKWLDLGQVRIFGRRAGPAPQPFAARSRPKTVPFEFWDNGQIRYDLWDRLGDVFSFGVTLYHLITGSWPWEGENSSKFAAGWLDRLRLAPEEAFFKPLLTDMLRTVGEGPRPEMEVVRNHFNNYGNQG